MQQEKWQSKSFVKKTKRVKKSVKKLKSMATMNVRRLCISRPDVLHTYLRHDEINQYLEFLEHRYSTFVKLHTLGSSFESRVMKAIEIDWNCPLNLQFQQNEIARRKLQHSGKPSQKKSHNIDIEQKNEYCQRSNERNIIFIIGGIHGREWISISTALNCIYQLTEKSERHVELLRKMRFIILPVSNPDGYEYSRTKNRRWRKNRHPHKNSKFAGIDINRNFDFNWDAGTSKAISSTYRGEKPFSEPETRAIRNVLKRLEPQLLLFLSLHSYAQCIMYPWGHTRAPPEDWKSLLTVATTGRDTIKRVTGRNYRIGTVSHVTEQQISGSVIDYVYGVIKVPFALVMDLPAKHLGFQPPAEVISPLGHESWYGISEMCKCAYGLHAKQNQKDELLMKTVQQHRICENKV